MEKNETDISCRQKEFDLKVEISKLPVGERQMSSILQLLELVRERKDTAVIIRITDEEMEDDVPQAVLFADSPDGIYMELEYSMEEWDWNHPLLLANDHLTEEEAVSVLTSIFTECTDENPIVFNYFVEISSRVYPEREEDRK